MLKILYEDSDIIVVWKPVGMESQSSRGFGADMVSEIRKHIHKLSPKSGEPYVGVIHRLDKPVSGVMVYAKTKTAAATLSEQVRDSKMQKNYLAILCGKPEHEVENFVDYLLKEDKENRSKIVEKGINGAKRSELICHTIKTKDIEPYGELTLVEIELLTGRHHQIRVQMAGHGLPLWGDNRYNPKFGGVADDMHMSDGRSKVGGSEINNSRNFRGDVALAAWKLSFTHPTTGKKMEFEHRPETMMFQLFQ